MTTSVTGTLDGHGRQVILQLLDQKGKTAFTPAREALELCGIQVERGQSVTLPAIVGQAK